MKRMMWMGGVALLLLIGVAAVVAPTTWTRQFDAATGGGLSVETDVGDVVVRTHDAETVRFEVDRAVDGSWGKATSAEVIKNYILDARLQDGHVVLEARFRRDAQGRMALQGGEMSRLQVRCVVYVPAHFDVRVQTGAGTVRVADLRGRVHAQSGSGGIVIGNIRGDVYARTASGDVIVGRATGAVDASTAAGEVRRVR